MKSDLQTALGFAKFFCPEIVEVDGCYILKERYTRDLFISWKKNETDKRNIEKMMNLYELKDFFHINKSLLENELELLIAFGDVLKYFWTRYFEERYPECKLTVETFEEYGELFITVYKK